METELLKKYPDLRKVGMKGPYSQWSFVNLRDGFKYFFDLYGHYPNALEVDHFSYLPSARSIQRSFGGLESLRKQLGLLDTHFGKGKYRSAIASRVNPRGRKAERDLEKLLKNHFGEMFVHTEYFASDENKCRLDFFIYSPDGNFGVDIFYPDSLYTCVHNINVKQRNYKLCKERIFLVVANSLINQQELDALSSAKKNQLDEKILIVTLENFLDSIKSKMKYSAVIDRDMKNKS